MKKILMPVLLIIIEVVVCVMINIIVDNKSYDEWEETTAVVSRASFERNRGGFRNGGTSYLFLSLSYLDGRHKVLLLDNYSEELNKGDKITIKVNNQDYTDIIYPKYESYKVFVIRRNSIIVTVLLVAATVWIYKLKYGKKNSDLDVKRLQDILDEIGK